VTSTRVRTHKPERLLNLPEGHAVQVPPLLPVYPASHEQVVLPSAEIELLGQSVHAPLPACAYLDTKVFDVASSFNKYVW
jgi:hypothetical protein